MEVHLMETLDPKIYPWMLVVYDRNFIPVRVNRFSMELAAIFAAKLIQGEYPHLEVKIIDERGCYDS